MLVIYCLPILFITFFYKFEGHVIINKKYQKWKSLNNLVKTRKKNKIAIIVTSIKILLTALYLSIIQYINKSVKKLDKNIYLVSYSINGNIYKMVVQVRKGPVPILQISNDKEEDITDYVIPYLGPNYDWHGARLSPQFFSCKSLTFELFDGREVTYNNSEDLNI